MVIKLLLTLYSFIFTMAMFGFLLYGIWVFKEAKKENSKIFIPTSSIKQITLTTEMRKLENQPVSQFGTQEKGDI